MRRSGHGRRAGTTLVALVLAAVASVSGALPGATPPAAADCGMQFPPTHIVGHRGFASEGVIRSIEHPETLPSSWQDRITMTVTEALAGDPGAQVVFDLGRGDCSFLQGDRYKVGDRLIVTATESPVEGQTRELPNALTWRCEWGDTWTALHAPGASFGGVEFYPDLADKASLLCWRLTRNPIGEQAFAVWLGGRIRFADR